MKRKIGIVGYGMIASGCHKNSYKIADGAEITAVCDIREAALEIAKKDFGLTDKCLFKDYKDMIDSGLCEIIDICTPNDSHCEIAKYALNAGISVSIEKPVALNAKEAFELKKSAEENELPVFVCFTCRYMATTRYLKALIDSGKIGKIYHCYIKCIKESGLWPGRRLEWRFDREKSGSGVLCDLGSHMIDLINWINEDIVGVSANVGTFVKKRQKLNSEEWADVTTDDYANIIANLKNGGTASIELSRCAKGEEQLDEYLIYGEKGYIKYSSNNSGELTVCFNENNTKEILKPPAEYGESGKVYQSQAFIDYVNGKGDEFTSNISDGLKVQIIIDAVLRAAEERRYVTVKEIETELK